MTMKDLYIEVGTDIAVVISRFGGNEPLLNRFIKKFPQDPSFLELKEALEKKDYEDMERSAHTLKGVASNLGFTGLSGKCANIVSAVRQREYDSIGMIFKPLQDEYEIIIKNIKKLD